MDIKLLPLEKCDLERFKADMQEAFQISALDGGVPCEDEQILPEEDINRSLDTIGAIAYKAVLDGKIVGGAIIVVNNEKAEGHLDFLYVKHGAQSKGIGKFIWIEIERLHPEIKVWLTCTPCFEKRNVHFYTKVCEFDITGTFFEDKFEDGMYEFRKTISPET